MLVDCRYYGVIALEWQILILGRKNVEAVEDLVENKRNVMVIQWFQHRNIKYIDVPALVSVLFKNNLILFNFLMFMINRKK